MLVEHTAKVNPNGVTHFVEKMVVRSPLNQKQTVFRRVCKPRDSFFTYGWTRGTKELRPDSTLIKPGEVTCKDCLRVMGLSEERTVDTNMYAVRHKTSLLYVKRSPRGCNQLVEHVNKATLFLTSAGALELTRHMVYFDGKDNPMTEADWINAGFIHRRNNGYYSREEYDPAMEVVTITLTVEER